MCNKGKANKLTFTQKVRSAGWEIHTEVFPSLHTSVCPLYIFFSWATPRKRKVNWICFSFLPWGSGYKKKKRSESSNGQMCLIYFRVYIINVLPSEQNFEFLKWIENIFVPKYERKTDTHNYQATFLYTIKDNVDYALKRDMWSLN